MHYGTNQTFGGPGQDLGGPVPPWPQRKTATVYVGMAEILTRVTDGIVPAWVGHGRWTLNGDLLLICVIETVFSPPTELH